MTFNNDPSTKEENGIRIQQKILDYGHLEYKLFEYTDHKAQDLGDELDPDNNLLLSNVTECKYFSEEEYIQYVNYKEKFSIIHFNSRSMYSNFTHIKEYLQQFSQSFHIIAISETWFNENKGIDFELEGYHLNYINRTNKMGGGVAIYVHNNIRFKVVDYMTYTINDTLECITIEILNEKKKNITVSCLYRSPGSSLDFFIDWVEKTFSTISNKTVFICGDFNIDLINPNNNKATDEFINRMHSMSFFPTITKPSRITSHSATLIDNIFTNNIEFINISGLMVCDITDHLPVFIIYDDNGNHNKVFQKPIYKRIKNDKAINSLYYDLLEQDWTLVYRENNVDCAFKNFLRIFTIAYDKNCPICQISKNNKAIKSPWITNGLKNACKKKNNLYKQFIRLRTEESEYRYKMYKNKLTEIMRTSKRLYYSNLLHNNKNNTKKVWGILN